MPQGQQVPPELREPLARQEPREPLVLQGPQVPPELREPLALQELLVLQGLLARQGPREPLVLQEPPALPVLREPPVRREPRRHRNCFPLIPHRLLRGRTMPLWTLIRTGKPLARELLTRRETARLQSRHRDFTQWRFIPTRRLPPAIHFRLPLLCSCSKMEPRYREPPLSIPFIPRRKTRPCPSASRFRSPRFRRPCRYWHRAETFCTAGHPFQSTK